MSKDVTLGKDVFMGLAALGWADGNLDADEADAIAKLALDSGLTVEEVAAIEEATKNPFDLADLDTEGMSDVDKLFVYAVGEWMATLDGELAKGEKETLQKLADLLGLDEAQRADAGILVREVAYASGGDRPFDYDLTQLRDRVAAMVDA
ncbi:MAG TPA: hypothetical protein RMH85_35700 [Polyangiaceae bacterium LLY-WYZ-15_(1-7)]|nr:hypothetical protein [Myxococcales bacterium]MAT27824.1 hypothetical protein [Sandaracinus sp.]HJK92395.1 hypothetical protein [Polyangiaceae bacterium LLY-WYZ-15_(1-7)]MBJ71260.1 hypothetical protein [Sandaracinus sp.]HJL05834.1 hypothetical protein [Polyangiaceae bacterium LLY-WYZ-15_(1-7)]